MSDSPTGLDLRDHFAGLAMQGIVSSIDGEGNYERLKEHASMWGFTLSEWIANESYKQADAMLRRRNR